MTEEHIAEASLALRFRDQHVFVTSTTSRGVANDKCDPSDTAQTGVVSHGAASSVGDAGFELAGKTREIAPSADQRARCATIPTPSDPDLDAIIARWPDLPEAIKAGIVAMVHAASGLTPQ